MRTVICDLCKCSLPQDNQLDTTFLGFALDLCPECRDWAIAMTGEEQLHIMLAAFREKRILRANDVTHLLGADAEPPGPSVPAEGTQSVPSLKGRYAPMKREVLWALDQYRKDNGPGCWPGLAHKAGVNTEQIAQVRNRQKVSLDIWTALAKSLGVKNEEES